MKTNDQPKRPRQRPSFYGERMRPTTVRLPQEQYEWLAENGGSATVRRLIDAEMQAARVPDGWVRWHTRLWNNAAMNSFVEQTEEGWVKYSGRIGSNKTIFGPFPTAVEAMLAQPKKL